MKAVRILNYLAEHHLLKTNFLYDENIHRYPLRKQILIPKIEKKGIMCRLNHLPTFKHGEYLEEQNFILPSIKRSESLIFNFLENKIHKKLINEAKNEKNHSRNSSVLLNSSNYSLSKTKTIIKPQQTKFQINKVDLKNIMEKYIPSRKENSRNDTSRLRLTKVEGSKNPLIISKFITNLDEEYK
jgi:hypothetical protein